jgi:hypothetical protein
LPFLVMWRILNIEAECGLHRSHHSTKVCHQNAMGARNESFLE